MEVGKTSGGPELVLVVELPKSRLLCKSCARLLSPSAFPMSEFGCEPCWCELSSRRERKILCFAWGIFGPKIRSSVKIVR